MLHLFTFFVIRGGRPMKKLGSQWLAGGKQSSFFNVNGRVPQGFL